MISTLPIRIRHIPHALRLVPLLAAALVLAGCLGGSIAQQLASSVTLHAADRMTASVVESRELGTGTSHQANLPERAPEPYWDDFVTAGFASVTPQVEPLPEQVVAPEAAPAAMTATPLLRVEIWNLLVGEEKRAFLEVASLRDATHVPPRNEWPQWQVAAGSLLNAPEQAITILIPPDFGRVASGGQAVVEQVAPGGLYYARYALN